MSSLVKLKKFFWFFLKLAIAGGIVGYLVARNPAEIADGFKAFDYKWLVPAVAIYFAHMLVCSWRWCRLTRMLGVELSPFEALSLTMQGYFFSLVIPGGAIGGDVVKMGVLSKRSAAGSRVEGAFTILMDRIIGMIALFSLALVLLVPSLPLLMKIELPQIALNDTMRELGILALAGLCLAGLGASCVIFFHRWIEKLPLLGALMCGVVRYTAAGKEHCCAVSPGTVNVAGGNVTVLARTAERAPDIDLARAEAALHRAESDLEARGMEMNISTPEAARARAKARIRAAELWRKNG